MVEDAAATVRNVFDAFLAGQGMSIIAKTLNDTGATTAKGSKWYASTVRYMLSNGFYAGLVQWGDHEDVEESHPAIISRELYIQAQQRLDTIKPGPMAE